ncbi:MAG: gliding motility lipoprotein GldD [Bacteroidetes bacterium]|nr:gliding motility lipoprotein GldD [Bacteroidota bacterium]
MRKFIPLYFVFLFLASCSSNELPKPRGYFRIELPEHSYRVLDTTFPYSFEYPAYSSIMSDPYAPEEPYWIDVYFAQFKAKLHLSYKVVNDTNLIYYLEDTRKFVVKHIPKANAIEDSLIFDREKNIYGLLYEIHGGNAASPVQFFVTDSTRHFVRGALYFNVKPNNDSLQPVIDFLRKDIDHLISTFRWKNGAE